MRNLQGRMLTSLFLYLLFGRLALANFVAGTFTSPSFFNYNNNYNTITTTDQTNKTLAFV